MKSLYLILILFPVAVFAQGDASQALQSAQITGQQIQHTETLAKWTEQLKNVQEQLTKAQEAVKLLETAKQVAGDPTKIASLMNSKLLGSSSTSQLGKTFTEISKTAGQASSLASSTQKVMGSPINMASLEDLQSGNIDFSNYDPMTALNTLENSFQNFADVMEKSEQDAKEIQTEIDRVTSKTPADEAEQRQKQADLAALQAKLADAKKRADDAYQKLQATKTLYETQKAKQGKQAAKVWAQGEKEKTEMYKKIDKLTKEGIYK